MSCKSCADKIIRMRELKKQRIKESDSLKRIALELEEQQKQLLNNNISFSTIKDITIKNE